MAEAIEAGAPRPRLCRSRWPARLLLKRFDAYGARGGPAPAAPDGAALVQGERTTWFCAKCQKDPARLTIRRAAAKGPRRSGARPGGRVPRNSTRFKDDHAYSPQARSASAATTSAPRSTARASAASAPSSRRSTALDGGDKTRVRCAQGAQPKWRAARPRGAPQEHRRAQVLAADQARRRALIRDPDSRAREGRRGTKTEHDDHVTGGPLAGLRVSGAKCFRCAAASRWILAIRFGRSRGLGKNAWLIAH